MARMDHFYFVRHGQTDANLQGLMCGGAWDIHLNETGLAQAQRASLCLRSHGIKKIFASPLVRARVTAEAIAKDSACPVTLIDELKEWHIGEWERTPFESIRHLFLGDGEPVQGESRLQFRDRVRRGFAQCRHHEGPVAIVSHGGVGMILLDLLGIPVTRLHNCVPLEFKSDQGRWTVRELLSPQE